ncbi:MAG: hypothetical protein AAFP04_06810 [Myxococcota bacterium]
MHTSPVDSTTGAQSMAQATVGDDTAGPAVVNASVGPSHVASAADAVDAHGRQLAGAASPHDTAQVPVDPDAASRESEAREREKPSFFRIVLEVVEFAARFFSSFVNLASAAMRILRWLFVPSTRPRTPEEWTKELSRLALDLIGAVFPPAAALGHLLGNAYWGAGNSEDTELLAGYDAVLHNIPLIGGLFDDQSDRDVYFGSLVRSGVGALTGLVGGGSDDAAADPAQYDRPQAGFRTSPVRAVESLGVTAGTDPGAASPIAADSNPYSQTIR